MSVYGLTRPRRNRTGYRRIIPPLLLLLGVLVLLFYFRPGFIKTVSIEGNVSCFSADALIKETALINQHYLLINTKEINTKLTFRFPCIKSVQVSYRFPSEAVLLIQPREEAMRIIPFLQTILDMSIENQSSPSAELRIDWSFPDVPLGESLIADGEGVIFAKLDRSWLPVLFYPQRDISIGSRVNALQVSKVKDVFKKMSELQNSNSAGADLKAKIYGSDVILDSQPRVIFSLKKDILKQLASLQLILQKAKIDVDRVDYIDLRFDKPVIISR